MAHTTLRAGVARVEITPPIGIQLFGYHRTAPMNAIHDPLWLTALAFIDDTQKVGPLIIVAIDHVGMGRMETTTLRHAVAATARTTIERVAICFSHTHSGPDTEALDWYGQQRSQDSLERMYGATLPGHTATVTRLAVQSAVPVRVGCAETTTIVGINRRSRNSEGRVEGTGVNPAGPVDPQVAVLSIETTDGHLLASLIHCGVHGTVFKGDNLACSADVTGAERAVVEAATGAPCLVIQGAAGDVNPRWRGDEAALKRAGWELGGSALRALAQINCEPLQTVASAAHVMSMRLLPLPDEDAAASIAEEVGRIWNSPTTAWLELVQRKLAVGERHLTLPIEIQAIRINDFVRVGIPMEPFCGLSLAVRQRTALSPHAAGICMAFGGYTNGLIGYLATEEEYAAGGYEIEWMPIIYGYYEGLLMPPVPETATEVIDAIVQLIESLCRYR